MVVIVAVVAAVEEVLVVFTEVVADVAVGVVEKHLS
jgi:hypothetical protein